MSNTINETLSWGQRFAIIDAFKPSNEEICKVFGVAAGELSTAQQLRNAGSLKVDSSIDPSAYKSYFDAGNTIVNPKGKSATVHTAPRSATKKEPVASIPGKRGKKGVKINSAFAAITSAPVPVETFATQHGVSVAVLRQSKRFDKVGGGEVRVKKDKATGSLMIWRDVK